MLIFTSITYIKWVLGMSVINQLQDEENWMTNDLGLVKNVGCITNVFVPSLINNAGDFNDQEHHLPNLAYNRARNDPCWVSLDDLESDEWSDAATSVEHLLSQEEFSRSTFELESHNCLYVAELFDALWKLINDIDGKLS